MSPLRIEIFNPVQEEWALVGEIKPADPSGSISQNKPDGSREVYLFECEPDDNQSAIYRSKSGVDTADSKRRLTEATAGLETLSTLKDKESYTISVKTDISDVRRIVRFTHIKAK